MEIGAGADALEAAEVVVAGGVDVLEAAVGIEAAAGVLEAAAVVEADTRTSLPRIGMPVEP